MPNQSSKGSGKPISKVEFNLKPSPGQREELLLTLKDRFERHMSRHKGFEWPKVQGKLKGLPGKLSSLYAMEDTGGEPDVAGHDERMDEYVFVDCSDQSPRFQTGRIRSLTAIF